MLVLQLYHVIPNFSLFPSLLLLLSLSLPLHVACCSVSECLCVGPASLPVTSVWCRRRANPFGRCADIITVPLWQTVGRRSWLCPRSIDDHKHKPQGFLDDKEAQGLCRVPVPCQRTAKRHQQSIRTVIYRPSLCTGALSCPLPLLIHLLKDRNSPKEWGDLEVYIREPWVQN